jgi:hypothetical protein
MRRVQSKKNTLFRQLQNNNQRLSEKFKDVLKKSGRKGHVELTL